MAKSSFNPFKKHAPNPAMQAAIIGQRPKTFHDRYGRELLEGDEVVWPGLKLESPTFVVAGIAPLVDPQAPPNMLRVTFLTTIIIGSAAGAPDKNLIKTRGREEVGPVPGVQYPAEALEALGWGPGGGKSAAPQSSDPDGSADGPTGPAGEPSKEPSGGAEGARGDRRGSATDGVLAEGGGSGTGDTSPLGESTKLVLP